MDPRKAVPLHATEMSAGRDFVSWLIPKKKVVDANGWKNNAHEPFYKEHDDGPYCVLHFPGGAKKGPFESREACRCERRLLTAYNFCKRYINLTLRAVSLG